MKVSQEIQIRDSRGLVVPLYLSNHRPANSPFEPTRVAFCNALRVLESRLTPETRVLKTPCEYWVQTTGYDATITRVRLNKITRKTLNLPG